MTEKCKDPIEALPGWCTREKAVLLVELLRRFEAPRVLEIGTFGGRSLLWMLRDGPPSAMFTAVDAWDNESGAACEPERIAAVQMRRRYDMIYEKFRAAVAAILRPDQRQRLLVVRADSLSAAAAEAIAEGGPYQLIHQDGNHSQHYSTEEVARYWQHLAPGGYWVADDIERPTLQRARQMLRTRAESALEVVLDEPDHQPRRCLHFGIYGNKARTCHA